MWPSSRRHILSASVRRAVGVHPQCVGVRAVISYPLEWCCRVGVEWAYGDQLPNTRAHPHISDTMEVEAIASTVYRTFRDSPWLLGRFIPVGDILGQGGYGVIIKAQDLSNNEVRACKLGGIVSCSKQAMRNHQNEAAVAEHLRTKRHLNVIEIYDWVRTTLRVHSSSLSFHLNDPSLYLVCYSEPISLLHYNGGE